MSSRLPLHFERAPLGDFFERNAGLEVVGRVVGLGEKLVLDAVAQVGLVRGPAQLREGGGPVVEDEPLLAGELLEAARVGEALLDHLLVGDLKGHGGLALLARARRHVEVDGRVLLDLLDARVGDDDAQPPLLEQGLVLS